jgi:hypothetical protein
VTARPSNRACTSPASGIDIVDIADIAVVNLFVVIVFDLHDFVAGGEGPTDFYFVRADDPESAVPRIIELVKTRIPQRFGLDAVHDIQVLCPMNRGGAGARALNIELQAALNPSGEHKVERFGLSPILLERSGREPALIRCALLIMRLWAACRKTSVNRTTGTAADVMMSAKTCPGPTEGSWSMSPTSSRAA